MFLAVLLGRCLVGLQAAVSEAVASNLQYTQISLSAFAHLWSALQLLQEGKLLTTANEGGTAVAVAAAAAATACMAAGAPPDNESHGSGSSSSSPAVRWGYLLRLHESRKLGAAAAAYQQLCQPEGDQESATTPSQQQHAAADDVASAIQRMQQLHRRALAL